MHNTTGFITRATRLIRVALHLAQGLLTVTLLFPSADRAQRMHYVQRWSARLLTILAVRMEISGALPDPGRGPAMMIANHVSWLDVYALNAVCAARFVAKSEILHWPLLGWFSKNVGTLFIERTRRRHIVTVCRQVAAALRRGDTFAVFPEATTSTGDVVLHFHSSLLQSALDSSATLHPVAIRYLRSDGSLCGEADYRHEKSLLNSLLLMVTQPEIRVRLHFLPAPECTGRHRRDIARQAALSIAAMLGVPALSRRKSGPDAGCPASHGVIAAPAWTSARLAGQWSPGAKSGGDDWGIAFW